MIYLCKEFIEMEKRKRRRCSSLTKVDLEKLVNEKFSFVVSKQGNFIVSLFYSLLILQLMEVRE